MIEQPISLRMANGVIAPAIIRRKENDPTFWLQLLGEGVNESATSADYFESFTIIRKRIAKKRILPLCNAASRNVWPSGMARDMGEGRIAYKIKIGFPSEELVNIFEKGSDLDPTTPEDQREFFNAWLKSLK
jgi:hypothetical protein